MTAPKVITITRDRKGIAVWEEGTKLGFDDGVFYDEACKQRGVDNLVDFLEDILNVNLPPEGNTRPVLIKATS